MRSYKWSKRELTDAVLYMVDSGCKWRQLPHDFPPYSTVHSFYRRARMSGLWDRILEHLVRVTRENAGRKDSPSYGIIDSQSVKTVGASEDRGIDGGKNERTEAAHRCRRYGKSAGGCCSCREYSRHKIWDICGKTSLPALCIH